MPKKEICESFKLSELQLLLQRSLCVHHFTLRLSFYCIKTKREKKSEYCVSFVEAFPVLI